MGKLSYFHPGQNTAVPLRLRTPIAVTVGDLLTINNKGRVGIYPEILTPTQVQQPVSLSTGSNAINATYTHPNTEYSQGPGVNNRLLHINGKLVTILRQSSAGAIKMQTFDKASVNPISALTTLFAGSSALVDAYPVAGTDHFVVIANFNSGTSILVRKFDLDGVQVGGDLTLSTAAIMDGYGYNNSILLPTGEIAVSWFGSAAGHIVNLAKFNPVTMAQVGANIQLSAVARAAGMLIANSQYDTRQIDMEVSVSGKLFVVFADTANDLPKSMAFSNAAGVPLAQVGVTQTLFAGNTTGSNLNGTKRICALGNDKVLWAVAQVVTSTVCAYVLVDDGSVTSLTLATGLTPSQSNTNVARLSDGRAVVGFNDSTAAAGYPFRFPIIKTDGTLYANRSLIVTNANGSTPVVMQAVGIAVFDGKFVIVGHRSYAPVGFYAWALTNDGILKNGAGGTAVSPSLGGTAMDNAFVTNLKVIGDNAVMTFSYYNNGAPTSSVSMGSIDSDGNPNWYASVNPLADTIAQVPHPTSIVLDNGVFYSFGTENTSNTTASTFKLRRMIVEAASIIGVASKSALANTVLTASTKGTFNINQNVAGASFNQNTSPGNSVVGNRGYIAGNTATLNGVTA
jgi:hypothetical protein